MEGRGKGGPGRGPVELRAAQGRVVGCGGGGQLGLSMDFSIYFVHYGTRTNVSVEDALHTGWRC